MHVTWGRQLGSDEERMRSGAWAVALAAAAIMIGGPAAAGVREGVEKWRAGEYKAAVTEWLPFAARGEIGRAHV